MNISVGTPAGRSARPHTGGRQQTSTVPPPPPPPHPLPLCGARFLTLEKRWVMPRQLGLDNSVLFAPNQGPVSWRLTTVKWRQFSQSNRHSTIGTRQTEYHEALPSSANVQSHLTSFADNGSASWNSVCRVPMVEWRLDCEDCRHLTVVGLHDTGPWSLWRFWPRIWTVVPVLSLPSSVLHYISNPLPPIA